MASALGLSLLLSERFAVESTLCYGGIIGRAENRAMVRTLKLPMVPTSRITVSDFDLRGLVDTQPAAGNHSLPNDRPPDIVLDHHPVRDGSNASAVCFISDDYGATSSMVTSLIREAGLEPTPTLATALFYGVKSDTRSLGREAGPWDTAAYQWLFPRHDAAVLAGIEQPKVPISHFRAYHTAYEQARLRRNVISVDLGEVYTPDIVPEIAERFLAVEGVKWSIALGSFESLVYVSVRTTDRRMNAGRQIQKLTADLGGSAGGHGQMAGARIPDPKGGKTLSRRILARFFESCGVAGVRGRSIVR